MGSLPCSQKRIQRRMGCYIGCAGWSIRSEHRSFFPPEGTHLEKYAQVFNAVEINTSFYRPHQKTTYLRWKQSVPAEFRFSVKLPREATHLRRLRAAQPVLERFLIETSGLGEKLGVILIQLPPSLGYEAAIAEPFFSFLRRNSDCRLALEARHASWFAPEVLQWRDQMGLSGVAADPAPVPLSAIATGPQLRYYRWHGAPRIYYSPYSRDSLSALAAKMDQEVTAGFEVWAILDNTALGHATADAMYLNSCPVASVSAELPEAARKECFADLTLPDPEVNHHS